MTTLQLKCIHGAPSVGGREPRTCQSHSSTFIFKVLNNIQQRFDERERERKKLDGIVSKKGRKKARKRENTMNCDEMTEEEKSRSSCRGDGE